VLRPEAFPCRGEEDMKLEFRPDFKFHLDFKAIWPHFQGMFKGLKFKPEDYSRMMKRILALLAWGLLFLIIAILLAKMI
jgi:hypothetical protein